MGAQPRAPPVAQGAANVTFEDAYDGVDSEVADLTSKVSLTRLQEAHAKAQAHAHKATPKHAPARSNRSDRSDRSDGASRCSRDTRSEADPSETGSADSQQLELEEGEMEVAGQKPKGGIHGRKMGAMRMLKRLQSSTRRSRTSTTASVIEDGFEVLETKSSGSHSSRTDSPPQDSGPLVTPSE